MNKQEYVDYFGEILTIQEALDRYYEVARELKQIFRSRNVDISLKKEMV